MSDDVVLECLEDHAYDIKIYVYPKFEDGILLTQDMVGNVMIEEAQLRKLYEILEKRYS